MYESTSHRRCWLVPFQDEPKTSLKDLRRAPLNKTKNEFYALQDWPKYNAAYTIHQVCISPPPQLSHKRHTYSKQSCRSDSKHIILNGASHAGVTFDDLLSRDCLTQTASLPAHFSENMLFRCPLFRSSFLQPSLALLLQLKHVKPVKKKKQPEMVQVSTWVASHLLIISCKLQRYTFKQEISEGKRLGDIQLRSYQTPWWVIYRYVTNYVTCGKFCENISANQLLNPRPAGAAGFPVPAEGCQTSLPLTWLLGQLDMRQTVFESSLK